MLWIVIDVGCFECGVSTDFVGCYTSLLDAQCAAAQRYLDAYEDCSWRGGGSAEVMIFNTEGEHCEL